MKKPVFFKQSLPYQFWWFLVAVLMIIIWFQLYGVYERYSIEREMAERRAAAESQLSTLEQQKLDLQERVQYMTDERGLEEELRQNFDVALPGERVYVLTGEADSEPTKSTEDTIPEEIEKPWYWFW